jgi:hypothetical protein
MSKWNGYRQHQLKDIDRPIRTMLQTDCDIHQANGIQKKKTPTKLSLPQILSVVCRYNMKWKGRRCKRMGAGIMQKVNEQTEKAKGKGMHVTMW